MRRALAPLESFPELHRPVEVAERFPGAGNGADHLSGDQDGHATNPGAVRHGERQAVGQGGFRGAESASRGS